MHFAPDYRLSISLLRVGLLSLLVALITPSTALGQFIEDFDRPNGGNIGNGWIRHIVDPGEGFGDSSSGSSTHGNAVLDLFNNELRIGEISGNNTAFHGYAERDAGLQSLIDDGTYEFEVRFGGASAATVNSRPAYYGMVFYKSLDVVDGVLVRIHRNGSIEVTNAPGGGGFGPLLGTGTYPAFNSGTRKVKIQLTSGNTLQVRIWDIIDPEPATWDATVDISTATKPGTNIALHAHTTGGDNTDIHYFYDNFTGTAIPTPFQEVAAAAGVDDTGNGWMVSWADYDGDGDPDLHVPNENQTDRLYRNDGGVFTDVAAAVGVDDTAQGQGVAWADYDNDGDLDFYLARGASANILYQNQLTQTGTANFVDVAPSFLVDATDASTDASWADLDLDGDVDLYVTNYFVANRLYRNDGATFVNIVGTSGPGTTAQSQGASWADYDDDGDPDIYLTQDNNVSNALFRNDGNGSFQNVNLGVADAASGRGIPWGDYDNDGDLDLYLAKSTTTTGGNMLFQNPGNGTAFTNVAGTAQIGDSAPTFGAEWGDYDNDGDLDLATANWLAANRLYENNGTGIFTNRAAEFGMDDAQQGRGLAWADMDLDGDLDLYVANGSGGTNRLYRNDNILNNWLTIDLVGTLSNNSGLGARIDAHVGANTQRRDVHGSNGQTAHESLTQEFGLGTASLVDELTISWPSGIVQTLTNVAVNQKLTIVEQQPLLPDGTPPPSGLVSWWKGEGDFTDTRGSNDGSAFGDVTFDTGIDGQALSFDGDNDAVPLGAPSNLQLQDLTFAAWIKRASAVETTVFNITYPGTIISQGPGGFGFYLYGSGSSNGNGRIAFGRIGNDQVLATTTVTDTDWHHVAVAKGSGYARFFLDGQLIETIPYTTGFSPGPIAIGTRADAHQLSSWLGLLDEVQVYNRDLTDNEVLVLYTAFTNPDVTIWAPDLTTTYNQPLSVPINVDNAVGLVSAEVFIEYDTALLTFAGVSSTGTLTDGWSVASNIEAGLGSLETVKIAVATDESNATGAATLLYVDFTVNDVRVPATSPLTLTHVLFNDGIPGNIPQNGSVTLVGNDGAISALPGQIAPSFSVGVTVADLDQDLDDQNPDQFNISVTVRDIGTNLVETEVLQVIETGNSTGVFTATIATTFSLTGNPGDGILQTQAGDQIEFLHIDLLDATGNGPINRIALVDVLGGDDGTIAVTLVTQPGDPIYILVDDEDLNDNPLAIETVQVTVTNGGDTEIVTLTEVDIDDDRFYGSVPTTSTAAVNGELTTALGDIASISYDDLFNTQGGAVTINANNQIINPWGDADSNGQSQAFDAAQILLHLLAAHLSPLELLSANVDFLSVTTGINTFDASLVLQKRVGLINTFPVQDPSSENHPQPDPSSTPKLISSTQSLSLVSGDGYLSVHAADRSALLSGDMTLKGTTGRVEMGADLADYLLASRPTDEGIRIVFAGAEAASGPGELLRVYGTSSTEVALSDAVFNNGEITGSASGLTVQATPQTYVLHPNMPNPFNPETTIRFELPQATEATLEVFDVLGQKVKTLVNGSLQAGTHSTVWHGRNDLGAQVGNGVYLYRLQANEFTQMRRMLLLK